MTGLTTVWNFRRRFSESLEHYLRGVGQAVRDIDANAAARTLHVFARFQSPYALLEIVPVSIGIRHQSFRSRRWTFAGWHSGRTCAHYSKA